MRGTLAAIVGDVVYVTSANQTARAFDRSSGNQLWQFALGGTPTMPVVADGLVIVGTNLGRVVAIGGS